MSLIDHAKSELTKAGLFDNNTDYQGMIGDWVMELVELYVKQHHTEMSSRQVVAIFCQLIEYRNLTPLTSDPAEWEDVTGRSGKPLWQSKRRSDAFSADGGKTYYLWSNPQDIIHT